MVFNPIWMNCSVLKKYVKSLIKTKEGSYKGFNRCADALLILLSFPGQNCVCSCLFRVIKKKIANLVRGLTTLKGKPHGHISQRQLDLKRGGSGRRYETASGTLQSLLHKWRRPLLWWSEIYIGWVVPQGVQCSKATFFVRIWAGTSSFSLKS